jgi:hypothetical protein
VIGLGALLLLAACGGGTDGKSAEVVGNGTETASLDRACASSETYDRLKELAFDEAARIRGDGAAQLDALSDTAVVRMEDPVVGERDQELGVTTCSGRFILELPPGAENAFDGERRLSADVKYAAQTAADGSGLVYQMEGAEPIIYRLATRRCALNPGAAASQPPARRSAPAAPRARSRPACDRPAPRRRTAKRPAPRAPVRPRLPPLPPPSPSARAPRQASAGPARSFNCAGPQPRRAHGLRQRRAGRARRRMSPFLFRPRALTGGPRQSAPQPRPLPQLPGALPDEACIAQAYRDRMDEIEDMSRGR